MRPLVYLSKCSRPPLIFTRLFRMVGKVEGCPIRRASSQRSGLACLLPSMKIGSSWYELSVTPLTDTSRLCVHIFKDVGSVSPWMQRRCVYTLRVLHLASESPEKVTGVDVRPPQLCGARSGCLGDFGFWSRWCSDVFSLLLTLPPPPLPCTTKLRWDA